MKLPSKEKIGKNLTGPKAGILASALAVGTFLAPTETKNVENQELAQTAAIVENYEPTAEPIVVPLGEEKEVLANGETLIKKLSIERTAPNSIQNLSREQLIQKLGEAEKIIAETKAETDKVKEQIDTTKNAVEDLGATISEFIQNAADNPFQSILSIIFVVWVYYIKPDANKKQKTE